MRSNNSHNIARMNRVAAIYNMIPNLFWSLLCLVPLYSFCYYHVQLKLIYWFASFSLLTLLIPGSLFDRLQFSRKRSFYKKIGIETINRFSQQGEWINKILRKKFPDYSIVSPDRALIKKLIGQTYMFEKFHFIMFVFFTLVTVFALLNSYWNWVIILLIANLIYNVYPNLLQQYVRIRLKAFLRNLEEGS
ncbi:MAG: hypothetical protein ACHQET_12360 [Chitinophagales bacterium]